jgi:serine/threonine protein phosphatase PrpC
VTVLRSGSATDVGKVRSSNQDVALEDPDLFAVADGMGGHVGGEVAARVAIDTLRASFRKQPTVEGLRRAVAEANRDVWRKGQTESSLRGMGTTLTATALVRDPSGRQVIALANVGDSRAYVFSRGQVIQITADHSLAEERVRQGEMTEAEAAIHPHRHILTRALGVSSDVDVDLWELHLTDGDRILLCSDGLTNEVGDEEIGRLLASRRDPHEAARALVRSAVDHGGNDNVTVVVVDVVAADETAGAPEAEGSRHLEGGPSSFGDAPTTTVPSLTDARASAPGDAPGAGGDPAATDEDPFAAPSAGVAHDADVTGVLPAVGSTAMNGRSGSRTAAADRAVAADRTVGSGGTGHSDPGGTTGVVTATRPPEGPREPGDADATNAGTGAPRAGAGPSPGRADRFATASPSGLSRVGGTSSAAPAVGRATAGGPRRPADFGAQAAELRRLRPTRKERRHRRRMAGIPRMVTIRVVLFMILLLAVIAAAYALVRWYATDDWYVGVDHQHLAVYQGRPGGFLWFKPKLVDETAVTTSEILPFHLPAVQAKHQEPSLRAARRYVANLHHEYLATKPTAPGSGTSATGGTSSSSTTTTAAAG